MLTLDRLQAEHKTWRQHNFPDSPDHHPLLGIGEEVGELMHAVLKAEQRIRGTQEEHDLKAQDALGDMLVFMADYCNRRGWSLQAIIEKTWDEVKARDWKKNPMMTAAQSEAKLLGVER